MGGNPDIFKMTIERKGKKVTLSGSEADVDAFWGLIRSHLSELDSACTYGEFAPAFHFENGRGGDHIEYIRATGAEQLWEHVDRTIGEGGKRDG